MSFSRRDFLKNSAVMAVAAWLTTHYGFNKALGAEGGHSHPNILLLMVDQQRIPPLYEPDQGEVQGLKEILGFRKLSPDNPYTRFFPGYLRLRQNAVVLRTHYAASAACVPSRTCIFTGSYKTGVDQTDGMFKNPMDVTWLDPDGTPTLGDWFQAAGYYTPYYGKWHVSHISDEDKDDGLEPWGFYDWQKSYPDAHMGGPPNMGVYRDVGLAEDVGSFLKERGRDTSFSPWFAVGSLANPHDNGNYPYPWQIPPNPNGTTGVVPWVNYPPPPGIPVEGQICLEQESPPGSGQRMTVPLNPDGFPQDTCFLPPTFGESLDSKPRCQYDYSLKYGLMTKTMSENRGVPMPYPFQLQGECAADWSIGYNQFYMYCHYLADLQLRKILQDLDESGLAENTIIIFMADHGELAGAHGGMIQKWHNAYEETIRVPLVISSPLVNKNREKMREILQPTSSIDLAPTLLGLAGVDPNELREEMEALHGASNVEDFVGADLSAHIHGDREGDIRGPDGKPRLGVLFMSNDMVTELGENPDPDTQNNFDDFMDSIEELRSQGYPLESGTVTQPNNVRALCTGDWKLVRYVDPHGVEADQWELYCLKTDPIEQTNLVDFRTGEVRADQVTPGLKRNELEKINRLLRKELARQEAAML